VTKRCNTQRASAAARGLGSAAAADAIDGGNRSKSTDLSHVPPTHSEPNEGAGQGRPKVACCFAALDCRKTYIQGHAAGYTVYIRSAAKKNFRNRGHTNIFFFLFRKKYIFFFLCLKVRTLFLAETVMKSKERSIHTLVTHHYFKI
jgi:hypothetical protein